MKVRPARGNGARRRAPRLEDVAKVAGVSHQTVSRVINASAHVRPETRERVLAAMRQLDYQPNSVARALATGRSRTIGVVSFDTTLYGPATTLYAIEHAAHEQGYFVSVASLQSLDLGSVRSAVDRLRQQGVDGVVVIAPQTAAAAAVLELPANVPVVAVEAGPENSIPVVTVDHVAGGQLATEHLLELGHRTVWHLAGPTDWVEAQQRLDGWRRTLQGAGADVPEPLYGDWSPGSGYELARQLVARDDVTAVFVANDQMALGVLRRLHEAGRGVPSAISVVGFDDIPEAAYFTPPLTTVRQDLDEMGRRSLRLLVQEIETGVRSTTRVSLGPELVVRATTARRGT